LANDPKNHSAHRDLLLDRLADAFEQHVNLAPLLQP
jgi:adenosylcobyric acid synthase